MITLNTFALLKNMAASQNTFETVKPDLEKAAVAAVKKALKQKGLTLDRLHEIGRAIGTDALSYVVGHDSMKDSDIKGLVKQFDKNWPVLTTAGIDQQRTHLLALAQGIRQPTEKLVAPRPPAKRRAAKPKSAGWSKSMSAADKKR